MDIGFIGLGNMGFPMARRLIEAGHQLDRVRQAQGGGRQARRRSARRRRPRRRTSPTASRP